MCERERERNLTLLFSILSRNLYNFLVVSIRMEIVGEEKVKSIKR